MRPSQLKSLTTMAKPGRNDPCPCGSGNKYKKCCLPKEEAVEHEQLAKAEARRAERAAAHRLHLREVKAAIAARLSGTEDGDEDELTIASNAAADLVRAGKLDEAVQAARDLLVRFPEVHDGYDRLGMVYEARGEDQQAADCYRKVIAFVREHPDDYDPGFEDVLCQARGSARPAGRHLIAAILLAIREGNIPAPITNHPHVVRAPPSTCGRRVTASLWGVPLSLGPKLGPMPPPINAGRNPMRSLTHVIALAALLYPLPAIAQQQPSGAPTAPPVVGDSLDGSTSVPAETSTLLFNGVVPRNGFMLQPRGNDCVVNDHGIGELIKPAYEGVAVHLKPGADRHSYVGAAMKPRHPPHVIGPAILWPLRTQALAPSDRD
jgi:hypothetical protein